MKTTKRPIYIVLALALLTTALPASASSADQPAFDIFTRIEAALAKAWAFAVHRIGLTGESNGAEGGRAVDLERAVAIAPIGPTGDPIGGTAPDNQPETGGEAAPPSGAPGG